MIGRYVLPDYVVRTLPRGPFQTLGPKALPRVLGDSLTPSDSDLTNTLVTPKTRCGRKETPWTLRLCTVCLPRCTDEGLLSGLVTRRLLEGPPVKGT